MNSHWKGKKPRWALVSDDTLMTAQFPLSCGTQVYLPRLFATRKKAREWLKANEMDMPVGTIPVRVELGYRRLSIDD